MFPFQIGHRTAGFQHDRANGIWSFVEGGGGDGGRSQHDAAQS